MDCKQYIIRDRNKNIHRSRTGISREEHFLRGRANRTYLMLVSDISRGIKIQTYPAYQ
jgi:hypothetical protein